VGAFVQELFRVGFYKRSQGRVARQATFAALAVIVVLGAWSLWQDLPARLNDYLTTNYAKTEPPGWVAAAEFAVNAIPLAVLLVGLWASFRIVQMPSFADFLISVEGEMSKVSWPSRGELFRASIVVMVVIFVLAALLYLFDAMWTFLLGWLF
jgi:preprotein translocase subunit SecE